MNKPKVSTAWKNAWKVWKSQPGGSLLFLLFQLAVRLMALCPLLFLAEPKLRWLALLSPVLLVLLVLPARQAAAETMQEALRGQPLFSPRMALGGASYKTKLVRGLKNAACILLWSLPLIVYTGWIVSYFLPKEHVVSGDGDIMTLMMQLISFGGGNMDTGILYLALIGIATLLPVAFGAAFHSGRRHEWALGEKRLVPGHRGYVLLCWLMGLAALVPCLLVVGGVAADYVIRFLDALHSMALGGLKLPSIKQRILPLAAGLVLLGLPALPLRSLVTAAGVSELKGDAD